jgi:hypothetical protein
MGEAGVKVFAIAAVAALVLGGCSTDEGPKVSERPVAAPASGPQTPALPDLPPPAPQTPAPSSTQTALDRCGANDLQWLVSKPKTEIPVPVDPTKRRVVCSTCVMTMDFNAERQTIVFDVDTGLVKSVRCG